MENQQNQSGQEINADFKKHKGLHPDSREVLEDDLVKAEDNSADDDGSIVKSSDPGSQEWHAREDVKIQEDK